MEETTVDNVKKAILSLGEKLNEISAIGITGSLAFGNFNKEKSDVDLFVISNGEEYEKKELEWMRLLTKLIGEKFGRKASVIFYPVSGLIKISGWKVISMASDGILIFDRDNIKDIFSRIVEKARSIGLRRTVIYNQPIWEVENIEKTGEVFSLTL